MTENQLSYEIIGAAIKVHRHFGPGLLESVYERSLVRELKERGFDVKAQVSVPYQYKDGEKQKAFRADILVNDLVLVEVKAIEFLDAVHFAQTLTYLKMTNLKLALLINFNVRLLREGIHRIVNGL